MSQQGVEEPEILKSVNNGVGTVLLNRPKALNSLSLGMVRQLLDTLEQWAKPSSDVSCVLIKGVGGKAFCAGGDVKMCVTAAAQGQYEGPDAFFSTEYALNLVIARLPVPYVAIIDGIVMGGGAGVSVHGHFRIATEKTVFAMPECAIGLFPDIGASFFLNQLPGRLGLYLGLTGARLTGVTVREAGIATHYLPSSALPKMEAGLRALGPEACRQLDRVAALLDQLQACHGPLPKGQLQTLLPLVDLHFGRGDVAGIMASLAAALQRLEAGGGGGGAAQVPLGAADQAELTFVRDALAMLRKGSPLSEVLTQELLRRAAHAPLATCLEADRLLVSRFVRGQGDFIEGVHAQLISKPSRPAAWKFAIPEQVPLAVVDKLLSDGPFGISRSGGCAERPAALLRSTVSGKFGSSTAGPPRSPGPRTPPRAPSTAPPVPKL